MINAREMVLKEKILGMKDLPTLTGNIIELIKAVTSDDVDMQEVIRLVKKDPVLVTKMMKMVNSSLYALPVRIDSVEMIVTFLGATKVKSIIMTASVMDTINNADQELWNHSHMTSVLMAQIIEKEHIPVAPGFLITALVHDIGQIVLNIFNAKGVKMAQKLSEKEMIPIHEAEKKVIGVDHAIVGAWLLELWELDESFILPVAYHHNHEEVSEKYLKETALLQFADYIEEKSRNNECYQVPIQLLELAGLEYLDVEYWTEEYEKLSSKI